MANFRGSPQMRFEWEHVSLSELKEDENVYNRYLWKTNIPPYPEPVLFTTSRVCHVTGESGIHGIIGDGGFLATTDDFVWFSLSVTKNDIAFAERRFLKWSYGAGACNQSPFLENFTTSPAFQSESRYGNFRFTFSLSKLLYEYARQFCYNSAPVLRVLRTDLYRQEILYSIVVHPPSVDLYSACPRLPYGPSGVCGYRDGRMYWVCQSPSVWYDHRLIKDNTNGSMYARQLRGGEYYVWDHVAVAFHMEPGWMLRIDREELFDSVSVCDMIMPYLLKEPDTPLDVNEAEEILEDLRETYNYE